MWRLIIFCIQRFQPDVYPRKTVHPSTRGGEGGTCPPCEDRGGKSPSVGGSEGQRSPDEGLGAVPPKLKIDIKLPCKSLVISSQSKLFIRQMI